MRSRIRTIRRTLQIAVAIAIAALVGMPDAVVAASAQSLDAMSQQELDRFVQELNESANWRKFRRPGDPPDFVPGKPVKVMHGAGASMGRGGGSGGFRRGGLANRRSTRSSRRNRDDAMAPKPRLVAVESLGRSSSSNSSFGSSSRSGSSSFGSSGNNNSSFGQ